MKSVISAAALLLVTTSAFADHTQFVTSPAVAPSVAPAREPNRIKPYSRSEPRFQVAPFVAPRADASNSRVKPPAPYSRSNPRVSNTNA